MPFGQKAFAVETYPLMTRFELADAAAEGEKPLPWVGRSFGNHKRFDCFDAFEETEGYLPADWLAFVGHVDCRQQIDWLVEEVELVDFLRSLDCNFQRIVRVDCHSFRHHLLPRPPKGEVGMQPPFDQHHKLEMWAAADASSGHSKWDLIHVGMESVPVGETLFQMQIRCCKKIAEGIGYSAAGGIEGMMMKDVFG